MRVSLPTSSIFTTAILAACLSAIPGTSGTLAATACLMDSPIIIAGFDRNSSVLPKDADVVIDKLAKDILAQNCQVTITGFASGGPSQGFDKNLGIARANAVAARLSSNSYPKQLLKVEYGNGGRLAQIQLANAQSGSTNNQPQKANSEQEPSPFSTAFAVESPTRAKPYDAILPGFWIGYDDKKKSVVNVSQIKVAASDKGQYVVRIGIESAAGSDWISVERTFQAGKKFKGKFLIRALANRVSQLQLALFIPRSGGKKDKQIAIGTASLGKKFKSFEFPISIDPKTISDIDVSQPPRIVAFLPKQSKSVVELSRFDVVPAGAN